MFSKISSQIKTVKKLIDGNEKLENLVQFAVENIEMIDDINARVSIEYNDNERAIRELFQEQRKSYSRKYLLSKQYKKSEKIEQDIKELEEHINQKKKEMENLKDEYENNYPAIEITIEQEVYKLIELVKEGNLRKQKEY
ncbi:MAG: hypothetical protein ACRC0Y_11070 [Fusobacteriaceae bacterium]